VARPVHDPLLRHPPCQRESDEGCPEVVSADGTAEVAEDHGPTSAARPGSTLGSDRKVAPPDRSQD
jgi:hypothetical protein